MGRFLRLVLLAVVPILGAGLAVSRRRVLASCAALAVARPPARATAAVVPEGCVYTGEGEYRSIAEGRKSNEPKQLNCSDGFVKGFVGEELVFTPLVLVLAAFIKSRDGPRA